MRFSFLPCFTCLILLLTTSARSRAAETLGLSVTLECRDASELERGVISKSANGGGPGGAWSNPDDFACTVSFKVPDQVLQQVPNAVALIELRIGQGKSPEVVGRAWASMRAGASRQHEFFVPHQVLGRLLRHTVKQKRTGAEVFLVRMVGYVALVDHRGHTVAGGIDEFGREVAYFE